MSVEGVDDYLRELDEPKRTSSRGPAAPFSLAELSGRASTTSVSLEAMKGELDGRLFGGSTVRKRLVPCL